MERTRAGRKRVLFPIFDYMLCGLLALLGYVLAVFLDWLFSTHQSLVVLPLYWFFVGVSCGQFLGEVQTKRKLEGM